MTATLNHQIEAGKPAGVMHVLDVSLNDKPSDSEFHLQLLMLREKAHFFHASNIDTTEEWLQFIQLYPDSDWLKDVRQVNTNEKLVLADIQFLQDQFYV